jgi:hypothetical protein
MLLLEAEGKLSIGDPIGKWPPSTHGRGEKHDLSPGCPAATATPLTLRKSGFRGLSRPAAK